MMSKPVGMASMPMAHSSKSSQCNGDSIDELHDEFDDWLTVMRSPEICSIRDDQSNQCCKKKNVYRFKQ